MVLPARMNFFPRCLRIDTTLSLRELILARIMKLMLRVSSESKYSFFNRKVIEHIVEKMDVVVINGSLTFSCPEVVKSEFDLQDLGCESYLRCGSSSSKAGLYFVEGWLPGGRLYKQGIFRGVFLKSMNAKAVNYSENSSEMM